jgi:hypothetical protein
VCLELLAHSPLWWSLVLVLVVLVLVRLGLLPLPLAVVAAMPMAG